MNRRSFLSLAFGASVFASQIRQKLPNVVFIMTDDHGAWATRAYGCKDIHKPHIDALARDGVRFLNAFAATPVCSPSRLTYFSGKLPYAHGVQDWIVPREAFGPESVPVLRDHETFAEVLARHGYRLGLSGKWHMGGDEHAQEGFSYWHTVPGGGGPYKDAEFVENGSRSVKMGFKTDHVGDGAVRFLQQHQKEHPGTPFFLNLSFYAPHTPYNYQPEEYRKPYEDSALSCYPQEPMHPWQNAGLGVHHNNTESMRAYSALITAADANIGKVLRQLQRMGVMENTLIIFTADQGWNAGHHGLWGKGNGTIPRNMYEESIRVPMIWRLPNRALAGSTCDAMISSYDFFPTLLDYLGLETKPDKDRIGTSYAPFLRGEQPDWRDRLFFEYAEVRCIRTRTRKLLLRASPHPSELYDLEADPQEKRNLFDDPQYASERNKLRRELESFFAERGAPPLNEWKRRSIRTVTEGRRYADRESRR
jgi:choline-sulfatase